ncbi:hypothetical protein [Egicoccus sp. AB-alg6-2]|uniref:hypothetical protein n=1 Tax=Egicoccus sp. AB-alg6-2 TaxID=3242692 RepID=UPI00359DCAA7
MGHEEGRPRDETALKAALSLVPFVGGALATVFGDEMDRRRERARETASVVAESVDAGELVSRLEEDQRLAALFAQAVESGARTTLREKRRAMADAVSRAVLDTARVDEGQLIIAALSDLDVPHLRELEAFRRRADAAEPDRQDAAARMIETSTSGMISPIEAALMRHGCIWSTSLSVLGGSTTHWGVTGFGRALLDELQGDDSGAA